MRQLPTKYLQEIFKSTQLVGVVLGLGSVVFLGGVCTKIPQANINSTISNTVSSTNIGSDVNVQTNSVGNGNLGTNTSIANANSNTNPNSHENINASPLDTSDWLTYTNEEYGFRVKYPKDWVVFNKIDHENLQLVLDPTEPGLRFTSEENNPAPETSFRDISIGVRELKNFNEAEVVSTEIDQNLVYKGEKYVIIIGATWPGDYELKVLDAMFNSITF